MLYGEIKDKILIELILVKNPRWERNRKYIQSIVWNEATNELRYISRLTLGGNKMILQQRYKIKIYYTTAVSYGSYDAQWEDQDLIWIDVPYSFDDTL